MAKFSENNSPWLTFVQQQATPGAPAAGLFRFFLNAANTFGLIDSAGNTYTLGAAGTNGTDGIDGLPGTDGTNGTNGVGVPAGGAANQILKKNSNTDYDTGWENPPDTGLADAPNDGNTYARNSAEWIEIAGGGGLSGGTAGQVLQKYDNGNGDFGWRTLNLSGGGGGSGSIFNLSAGVPPLSAFTQFDPANFMTYSEEEGKVINMKVTSAHPNVPNIAGIYKPVPTSPTYVLSVYCFYGTTYKPYNGITYGWHDPVSGKYDSCCFEFNTAGGASNFENQTYTDPQTRSGNGVPSGNPLTIGPIWLHLGYDGTNIKWGWSSDGFTIVWIFSASLSSSYLGAGNYTNIYIGIFPDGEGGNSFVGNSLSILCWDENGTGRDYTTLETSANVTSQPNYQAAGLLQYIDFRQAKNAWCMDQASGQTCYLVNAPILTEDGVETDGSDNFIDANNGPTGQRNWSAAVRFKTTSTAGAGPNYYENPSLWNLALNGQGGDGGLAVVNGYLHIWQSWTTTNDQNQLTTAIVNDGNWHTAVITMDWRSGTLFVYCDGVQVYTASGSDGAYGKINSGLAASNVHPYMGVCSSGDFQGDTASGSWLAATFGQLAIWNVALSPAAVAQLDLSNSATVLAAYTL